VRSSDHLLNTVLRAGLELGARLAQDTALKGAVRGLVAQLGYDVGTVRLDEALLRRAFRALDRLTRAYEPALRLIEVLLACSAMSLEGEETTALRGFLFDMNRFFQALVGKLLRENLEGLTVDEERGLAMMRYLDGFNPRRRRAPTPRPDFIVREDRKAVAILDAKYRELWEKDLPREMLYQLAMYALAQGRGATAAIVYPTLSAAAVEAVIEIVEPIERRPVGRVALRPLVLPELVAAIRSGERTKASQGIARRLALGQESP
jgi:5-methylcytosine-specific restriction enzyme subunit McrC